MVVEFGWQVLSECLDCDSGILECLSVEVEGEEESYLIALHIFLGTVEIPVIFEEVEAELKTTAGVGAI